MNRVVSVLSLLAVFAVAGCGGDDGPAPAPVIWKVDAGVTVSGDGMTWATAFKTLQKAFDVATAGQEIWVAAGTYYPTTRSDPATARTETFRLLDGVAVYGGFDGTETTRSARDWATNVTTLSGDIGTTGISSDDTYHVVTGVDNATLDGFTITAGNANGSFSYSYGGGMSNYSSSPTVTNCVFSVNSADYGGGMFNDSSSPTLTNCVFSGNSSGRSGGGMHNQNSSSPTVTNCTFSGNSAIEFGGGMCNYASSPMVTNCILSGNLANYGGGIYNISMPSPAVTNCTFSGNSANRYGGGMFNAFSSPTVTNCTFTSNSANYGGGMHNKSMPSPAVTNCTFSGNSANAGGGLYNNTSSPTVMNCILWGNSATTYPEVCNASSTPTFSHCDIAGCGGSASWDTGLGTDGGNNIDSDPMLTNAPAFVDMTTADGTVDTIEVTDAAVYATIDVIEIGVDGVIRAVSAASGTTVTFSPALATTSLDNTHVADWGSGATDLVHDLRLSAGSSPCVDTGDTAALPPDTADLDGDTDATEDIPYDLDNNPRVSGSAVDMGAYEVQ